MAKKLAKYNAKRDFSKTLEPRGNSTSTRSPAGARSLGRFVIQKHAASRLHYDLRLEVDGVFRSWAVTRGPSINPADKRLAVEVEDHPLSYGDFEGTIPAGEYGGGTVQVWDQGTWQSSTDASAATDLKRGELKFDLHGKRLHGSWVLVRMRSASDAKRRNWLLIKHSDAAAGTSRQAEALLQTDESVISGKSLAQLSATTVDSSMSHPEKILWPATDTGRAFTKRDLADYLHAASARLLPHLQGRPCSILRAPDGITGEQFFQRHVAAGASARLRTIKLAGDRKPYLIIDSVEALAALAQLGTLELHPGNGVPGDPETPGRLVFDLDPAPELDFTVVIDAALELRTRLQDLGLTAFCKTTGGKGLHVVVPLEKPRRSGSAMNWPSAKLFAQTLCAQMAADSPRQYLITMSKAARRGRIFLDYLRNERLATAVAPLSPRARPGATVSTPLDWKQVRHGLDPAQFTLSTALSRLAKSQAWSDYDAAGNSLPAAIKALLRSQGQAA